MIDPLLVVLIAIAGGLGSVARLLIGRWRGRLPWGTLLANSLAGLVIGFLQVEQQSGSSMGMLSAVLYLGFCGGLSTFSAVAADTGDYIRDGKLGKGALNLVTNLVVPVVALGLPILFLVILVN